MSDLFVIVGLLLLPLSPGATKNLPGLRSWMFLPALIGLLLAARDVVVVGRPFTAIEELGAGLSPAQMLARVVLSTVCVAVLSVLVIGRDVARGRRILRWWIGGVVSSSVFALLQAIGTVPEGTLLAQVNGTDRYAGLSSHPNALAQTIVLAIPVVLYYLRASMTRNRLVAGLGFVLLIAALFQTGSRAGLLIGFAVVVVSIVHHASRTGGLRWVLPIVILATAAAVVFGPALIRGTRFVQSAGTVQSNVGRTQAIGDGWELFVAHPVLGAGLGSWVGELAPLVLLASGGVLFLVAYSTFVAAPILILWRSRQIDLAAVLLISAVAVVLLGLLNNGFTERYTFWPVLIGASLFLGPFAPPSPSDRKDDRSHTGGNLLN
ncbi:O-antigen ligase [Curtobacterium sp. MCBD17_021]|uniref:O-antigen ligase family protein n=1 Tax=Curtobacterium sp. MCBD17_021 TaxID=2175665 RepID=UPI0015E8E757|nr:O-antigen ligase family protein [Curtobacterium sp. MCBD17_021]